MAFTDLDEELEQLGYSHVFDTRYGSGRVKNSTDGFSYRPIPKFSRSHDSVGIDELARRGSREDALERRLARAARDHQHRYSIMQSAALEDLRELWYAVRDGRVNTESGARMRLKRAA